MLIHDFLEEETLIAIRIAFNQLLRVEQHAREDKVFGSQIPRTDENACFVAEPIYQGISTLDQLDKIICATEDRESAKVMKHLHEAKAPA